MASAIVALTNQLRAQHGLAALTVNSSLTSAAQTYSRIMAVNDWFSHEGPDGSTMSSRVTAAGYAGWSFLGENLYRGFYADPASSIVQAWMDSPAHRDIILSPKATEIGVGCYVSADFRWCAQEFGAR